MAEDFAWNTSPRTQPLIFLGIDRSMQSISLKPLKTTYAWSLIASISFTASNLLLLPLLTRYLDKTELGIWFVFLTLGSLVTLVDFGFQSTILRNNSLVVSGSNIILRHGIEVNNQRFTEVDLALLNGLVAAGSTIYRKFVAGGFIIIMIPVTAYLYLLLSSEGSPLLMIAWLIYASACAIMLYCNYNGALLTALGSQDAVYKFQIVSKLITLVSSCFVLALGYGLIGLAVSLLIGSIVLWYFLALSNNSVLSLLIKGSTPEFSRSESLIPTLWHNAKRFGMVQVGAFLIQRSSLLVAASALGLATSASYSLTMTLMLTALNITFLLANVNIPFFSQLRQQGKAQEAKETYYKVLASSMIVCVSAYILILLFGQNLLLLVGSNTSLLPQRQILLIGVVLLLELNRGIASLFITAGNKIPFCKPAIISGMATILLSILAAPRYGVVGLILAQGIVQILYNNWKWPLTVFKDLRSMETF